MGAAIAALVLAGASPAAAMIIWSDPVDSTGLASDVITTGRYVDSLTFGPTTTVNGVTFLHQDLGVPNTADYGVLSDYGHFQPGWDPAYRNLVGTSSYLTHGYQLELDFDVLPAGSYILQLFMPQWDVNWATEFWLNDVLSAPVQAGGFLTNADGYGFYPRDKPQWISARFTADGHTSFIVRTNGITGYQMLSAMQLRAVPEPETWVLLIAGFGLSGAALRLRRSAASA